MLQPWTRTRLVPKRFAEVSEAFRICELLGTKEQLPRWKRCTAATDAALGQALGKAYVVAAFPPAANTRAKESSTTSRPRYDESAVAWMSAPTNSAPRSSTRSPRRSGIPTSGKITQR